MKKYFTLIVTMVMAIMIMTMPTTMANATDGAVISADFVPERPVGYARESYRLVIHGDVMPIVFNGPFAVYEAIRHEGLNGTPLTAILIEETYGVSGEDSTGFGSAICRYPVDSFCKKWGYELPLVLTCNATSLKFFVGDIAHTGEAYTSLDDVYNAATVLKDAGYVHSLTPVLGVAIPDSPGGLNRVLEILTDASVNVEYMYAFLGGKDTAHAYMIFRVEDVSVATEALRNAGIRTVGQEEMGNL